MAVYTGDNIHQLDITTPTEGNPPSELNDADREIKKVLKRQYAIATLTGATTLDTSHSTVICNSASAFAVTLPTPSTVANATHLKAYTLNNKGAGVVTITGTVDGVVNPTLAQNEAITVYTDGTSWYEKRAINATNATNTRNIRDISRGLIVKNNVTNPNYQVDIDADEIILQDSSGVPYRATVVNLTADIAVSGVNGLDTGTEAASTWYHIWVIYNGTTVAGLLSTSSTAPTMPTGYTYKALVGAIFNNSGGTSNDFLTTYQQGNRVRCNPLAQANITSSTVTAITLQIPSSAKKVIFSVMNSPVANIVRLQVDSVTFTTDTAGIFYIANLLYSSTGNTVDFGFCFIETAQTIYAAVLSPDGGTAVLYPKGWEY